MRDEDALELGGRHMLGLSAAASCTLPPRPGRAQLGAIWLHPHSALGGFPGLMRGGPETVASERGRGDQEACLRGEGPAALTPPVARAFSYAGARQAGWAMRPRLQAKGA